MGEIAEMMLDGTMCAGCGEFMNDGEDGNGFPEYCARCSHDYEEHQPKAKKAKTPAARLQSVTDKIIALLQKEVPSTTGSRKQLFIDIQKLISPYILPPEEK